MICWYWWNCWPLLFKLSVGKRWFYWYWWNCGPSLYGSVQLLYNWNIFFNIKSLNWLWQLDVTTGVYLSNVYIVLIKSPPSLWFALFISNLIPFLSPCFCISIYLPIFRWPRDSNLFNECIHYVWLFPIVKPN